MYQTVTAQSRDLSSYQLTIKALNIHDKRHANLSISSAKSRRDVDRCVITWLSITSITWPTY